MVDISAITVFCLSDGIVDSQDRMYIGDIGYNFFDPANKSVDTCVITCIEADGSARVVARDLSFPNGMVITPDGKTLIVAETTGHRLTAYDVLPTAAWPIAASTPNWPRTCSRTALRWMPRAACGSPTRKAGTRCCGCGKAAKSLRPSISKPMATLSCWADPSAVTC